MHLSAWFQTDVGKKRDHNEDAICSNESIGLFAVADGMGGHAAGEVASKLAVESLEQYVVKTIKELETAKTKGPDNVHQQYLQLLDDAVQAACRRIFDLAQADKRRHGMGTTLSAILVRGNDGYVAHVGDSRIYLLRENECHQLTEDHSLVREQIRRGTLAKKDLPRVRYKNVITRALGIQPNVKVDTLHFDILPGDKFVLCSDGLHGYLKNGELVELAKKVPADSMCKTLVEMANQRGGRDNISVIFLQIATDENESARELRKRIEIVRNTPLCRYLNFRELAQLLNRTYQKTAKSGQLIIEENTIGEEMFLLVDGEVQVLKGEQEIARLGPGSAFGEMALIDNAPRSATVKATKDCRLVVIGRKQFYDTIKNDPRAGVKLLWSFLQTLSLRLRSTDEQLKKAREEACIIEEIEPDWMKASD